MSESKLPPWGYVFFDVKHPVVAWMVYRGVLQSNDQWSTPNLMSFFTANTLRRNPKALIIEREGRLEGARQVHTPGKLSRLNSIFAYPDLEAARHGAALGHFRMENIAEIIPATDQFRREVYNADLIDQYGSLEADKTARCYWIEPADGPHREMLLTGRFHIMSSDLKSKAKKTIWALGKESRVALELSRLGACFGSEFGAIYPFIEKLDNDQMQLSYQIRWEDQLGAEILSQAYERFFKDPDFYIDWKAIRPITHVTPQQRDPKFFKLPDFRGKLNNKISQEAMEALQAASYAYVQRHQTQT